MFSLNETSGGWLGISISPKSKNLFIKNIRTKSVCESIDIVNYGTKNHPKKKLIPMHAEIFSIPEENTLRWLNLVSIKIIIVLFLN